MSAKENFVIEESPVGRTLVVTGPWSSRADELLRRGQVDGLTLNYAKGFCNADISFFRAWPLRRLTILDRSLVDLEPISKVASSLLDISIEVSNSARLEDVILPNLISIGGDWQLIRSTVGRANSLRKLFSSNYDESDLIPILGHPNLGALTLKVAPRMESLRGVAAFSKLSKLGIHLAPQLTDTTDLIDSELSLLELRFEFCWQINSLDSMKGLIGLQHLGVSDCRQLESLNPLRNLFNIEVFHAWGSTEVLDCDLSALLDLPRLREIRMRSRRKYNPSLEQVKKRLRIE
jgi:hypothetical protein